MPAAGLPGPGKRALLGFHALAELLEQRIVRMEHERTLRVVLSAFGSTRVARATICSSQGRDVIWVSAATTATRRNCGQRTCPGFGPHRAASVGL